MEEKKLNRNHRVLQISGTILQSLKFLMALGLLVLAILISKAGANADDAYMVNGMLVLVSLAAVGYTALGALGIAGLWVRPLGSKRLIFTIYTILLVALYSYGAWSLNKHVDPLFAKELASAEKHTWKNLSSFKRAKLQQGWNCCGYASPQDDPELPCPEGAVKGCKEDLFKRYVEGYPDWFRLIQRCLLVTRIVLVIYELLLLGLSITLLL